MEYLLVTSMIVGVVELIRRIQLKEYFAAITIVAAAATGAICGALGVEGIDIAKGIVLGLAGSGIVTIVSKASTARTK
jgi:3-dehydroquinate dehydratase